ncbi:MAG: hypothetical protein M0024_05980 [Nitrospiraceae bacterium]|nr:hypothetical protein [Nitrospiraceae bacterium]
MKMKLGEALVKDGLIKNDQLRAALDRQVMFGGRIGSNIVELGYIKEQELAGFLSKFFNVPGVKPSLLSSIEAEVLGSISREVAEKFRLIPFRKDRKRLHVAMSDPYPPQRIDELRFITGFDIIPHIVTEMRMLYALEKYYGIERNLRYISTGNKLDEEEAPKETAQQELLKLKEEFASAKTRDEVIGLLLHTAGKLYTRVALFVVKGNGLVGWKSRGLNVENQSFELHSGSLFGDVLSRKSYYRGPLLRIPGNAALVEALNGTPQDCYAAPLMIRDKVIGLLYIDNGNRSVLDANLGYVNKILSLASYSFEISILRKKILDL